MSIRSKNPNQWRKWLEELESEEEDYASDEEIDPAEDDCDSLHEIDHKSQSEQDADESGEESFEDTTTEDDIDVPCYTGKDGITYWIKKCPPGTSTRAHNMCDIKPGPVNTAVNAKNILECLECFVSQNILEIIVASTNLYINCAKSNYSRNRDPTTTDICEIKAVFGILYLLGTYKSGRQRVQDFWSTDGTGIEAIYCTMSYQRFRFLLCSMQFDNIISREERQMLDKLTEIREIFEMFVDNCQKLYIPERFLTVDEQLVSFRGRCPFRKYLPTKPAKYGIKIFALVDVKTMYTVNLEIYPGTQPAGPYQISNKPIDVVKRLVTVVKGTWRNITIANWFTSFPLAIELKKDFMLTMLGTVRKNKKEIPAKFVNVDNRTENSSLFGFHNDCTLLSYIPKKKKNVLVLSTMHDNNGIDELTSLPHMIQDYNNTKYGVDIVDKMCGGYNVARKSRRWPLTIFFNIMNISGINALVLCKTNNPDSKISRREFLRTLALDLMKTEIQRRMCSKTIPRKIKEKSRLLIDDNNTPIKNEEAPPEKIPRTSIGRCFLCPRKKDKKTRKFCELCEKWICNEHQKKIPVICVKCGDDSPHENISDFKFSSNDCNN